MWRMLHGAPHWEVSAKKMWSPGPPASREPVRLPFLDVTPTTVLQRLRDAPDTHHAHHTHVEVSMGQVLGGGVGRLTRQTVATSTGVWCCAGVPAHLCTT